MIAPKHILGTFDEALASLRNNVLMMSSLTERSLDRAINGLLQRDDDLCAIAIADDEEIDQLEKQIDKDGIDLLLRFQPVASDLRRVVSAMKLSSNLERMADQAVEHRAQGAQTESASGAAGSGIDHADVRRTRWRCSRTAIDAYVREDVQLARAVRSARSSAR